MNGKGDSGLTIGTIIVIILSVVVLVFLIYGFTVGWNNLFDKIGNFGGGESNVQTIVQSCEIACTTGASYDYNTLKRDVKFGEGKEASVTCKELEKEDPLVVAHCEDSNGDVVEGVVEGVVAEDACVEGNSWIKARDARWSGVIISPACTSV